MLHNCRLAKPYGLANQKLCYIQMIVKIEKFGEQDKERSQEWLVNTDADFGSPTNLLERDMTFYMALG